MCPQLPYSFNNPTFPVTSAISKDFVKNKFYLPWSTNHCYTKRPTFLKKLSYVKKIQALHILQNCSRIRFKGANTPSAKRQHKIGSIWIHGDAPPDIWEWVWDQFWSVTMHSSGTLPLDAWEWIWDQFWSVTMHSSGTLWNLSIIIDKGLYSSELWLDAPTATFSDFELNVIFPF